MPQRRGCWVALPSAVRLRRGSSDDEPLRAVKSAGLARGGTLVLPNRLRVAPLAVLAPARVRLADNAVPHASGPGGVHPERRDANRAALPATAPLRFRHPPLPRQMRHCLLVAPGPPGLARVHPQLPRAEILLHALRFPSRVVGLVVQTPTAVAPLKRRPQALKRLALVAQNAAAQLSQAFFIVRGPLCDFPVKLPNQMRTNLCLFGTPCSSIH